MEIPFNLHVISNYRQGLSNKRYAVFKYMHAY